MSPTKGKGQEVAEPRDKLPRVLPEHLRPFLDRQKRAILRALQHPPEIDEIEVYGEDYPPTNTLAYEHLSDLLAGSVVRGEGNSCLLIGPSGSGKTQVSIYSRPLAYIKMRPYGFPTKIVERAIAELPTPPIVIRLSGHAQHNDRLAIREIAWQLAQQTGQSFLPTDPDDAEEDEEPAPPAPAEHEHEANAGADPDADADADEDEDENPFVEPARPPIPATSSAPPAIALPPPAHLLALISMIPTLPRATVIVLDGFDLFAAHARQALLYCLLDTAQACRASAGAGSGMAVVGVTARVDTINLLEKRVKSRFSGRMIRTACPARAEHWVELARAALGAPVGEEGEGASEGERAWAGLWARAVEGFLGSADVGEAFRETYALTRDLQMFRRIMVSWGLSVGPYLHTHR